ncbi:hypothetical protein MmTuc01_2935 [Methanosarcina mazei Tuc01]|jgi:hypothetical protein|uniref:Uncharacterized protein n=1 Tax=Methanosarcina mazei Tuc01 TaxID=1236903 RepID=M1PCF0_METMZ|nr:hypothetical protein MmTuc01_2935 [Methanosarcina mazei Tuc01]
MLLKNIWRIYSSPCETVIKAIEYYKQALTVSKVSDPE